MTKRKQIAHYSYPLSGPISNSMTKVAYKSMLWRVYFADSALHHQKWFMDVVRYTKA